MHPEPVGASLPRNDADTGAGTPVIAAITVTFNPDVDILSRQLDQLPAAALKVWIDNATAPGILAPVRVLAAARDDVVLVENGENVGLAKALNQGANVARARYPACEYLIFLDQDTEPGAGGVESLLDAFQQLGKSRGRLGCVGPRLIDVDTGLAHGFHLMSGWRWVRRYPVDRQPLAVANLNGSGILMRADFFREMGGLNEAFFIDHVDTEWSFRVLASGHELFGIPGTTFKHRMGVKGIRVWFFGWHVWPYRSPARHFYLFRNTARLLRTPGVPLVWKAWAPAKLSLTMFAHVLFDSARWQQARQMLRGLRAGLSKHG